MGTSATQLALNAIAEHFGARSAKGHGPIDAYLTKGGRRVAVMLTTAVPARAAVPRLRYDRVALRFVRDVRERLRPYLTGGETALFTIQAPIIQAGKTVAALEERMQRRRSTKGALSDIKAGDLGNRIRLRILANASRRPPEILGFVHSEGANPAVLLNAAQWLLDCIAVKGVAGRDAGDCWLAVAGSAALGPAYRDTCAQLSNPSGLARILLVAEDGRIEILAG